MTRPSYDPLGDPGFLRRLAELATRISDAADSGDVAIVLYDLASLCGTDGAAFASVINDDERFESCRVIVAGDAPWFRLQSDHGRPDDPWLDHARRRGTPVVARRTAEGAPLGSPLVLPEEVGTALIAPALPPRGMDRCGYLVLATRDAECFEGATLAGLLLVMQGVAQALLEWQTAQLRSELLERAKLSSLELQLLATARRALSSKEMARLTRSSPVSVDSRWQRLKSKLRVSSRQQALRLAAEFELGRQPHHE